MDKFPPDKQAELANDIKSVMDSIIESKEYLAQLSSNAPIDIDVEKYVAPYVEKWKNYCK